MKRATVSLNYNQINKVIAGLICLRQKYVETSQIAVLDETSRILSSISYDINRIDFLINELEKIRERGYNLNNRNEPKLNDDDIQD